MSAALIRDLLQLRRQQWFSRYQLEALQLSKLRRLVQRAWDHSPFYRELYQSVGFEPEDLKSLSDLRLLPVVTKSQLIAAGESAFTKDLPDADCIKLLTSGSSGQPISLRFTRQDKAHRVLKELRALQANGYRPTDKMLILVAPSDVVKKKEPLQRIGLLRRYYMSVFDDEIEQINRIKSIKPEVIYSYTSTLRILAERIIRDKLDIAKPKLLISAAEVLDPTARHLFNSAFGVEPADFYGSMEFGWLAWQFMEPIGYHINADCLIVECLHNGRPSEPGEEGELIITNLHSDAAPLIRYAIGDTGIMSADNCKCGRTLPLMQCVGGRLADRIVLPSGRVLTPYKLTCAVENVPGVRQFQIIQETKEKVRVLLLKGANTPDTGQLSKAVEGALGEPVKVQVNLVESLDREPNGKFKVVKSFVDTGLEVSR